MYIELIQPPWDLRNISSKFRFVRNISCFLYGFQSYIFRGANASLHVIFLFYEMLPCRGFSCELWNASPIAKLVSGAKSVFIYLHKIRSCSHILNLWWFARCMLLNDSQKRKKKMLIEVKCCAVQYNGQTTCMGDRFRKFACFIYHLSL